jgi:hypothetical protein
MGAWTLHLGERALGRIVEQAEDFPRLEGRFTPEPFLHVPSDASERRLADFYRLNCESQRLVDTAGSADVAAEVARNNAELEAYRDLIENEAWTLRSSSDVVPILCPFFRSDGTVTWSWRAPR